LYKELGCSNRVYDYTACLESGYDVEVNEFSKEINEMETEYVTETPVGTITEIRRKNSSNYGECRLKWPIANEDDMKTYIWLHEHTVWSWHEERYDEIYGEWGNICAPTLFFPRVNVQNLFVDTMGVMGGTYALYDYPDTVEKYFAALSESCERAISVLNSQDKIQIINFGDNIHSKVCTPELFGKYVLPEYQKRNELLHRGGKYTNAHWDGDCKGILQYAKDTDLDAIEAITPLPQGDVTLDEIKEGLGDDIILMDGIAAILFDETFEEQLLIDQTNRLLELFPGKLVLGISDEMSSTGNIDRIKTVGRIVDDHNASLA
jgi:hypothetical protein